MKPFAFVFPGPGLAVRGHARRLGRSPGVVADAAGSLDAWVRTWPPDHEEGPKEALALTTNTQPVMLVAGVAAYRAWLPKAAPRRPSWPGHSLGEYSALVAAGVLTLAQAAPLVRFRAAGHAGRRAGGHRRHGRHSGHGCCKVIAGCAEVTAAMGHNRRSGRGRQLQRPAQTVIAGSKAGVDKGLRSAQGQWRQARAAAAGVGAVSFQPDEAGRRAAARTRWPSTELGCAADPVINNIDVAWKPMPTAFAMRCTARRLARALGRVRAGHQGARHHHRGRMRPGKVLAGMVKRIDAELTGMRLYDPATLAEVKGLLA
jgi:[acyl-carrier-protein] S-malonyltransferase